MWGGQVLDPLLGFITRHRDIDVFCFQEVYHLAKEKVCDDDSDVKLTIFSEIAALLPDHHPLFKPVVPGYGIGMFIKKKLDVLAEGEISIHENPHYKGRGPTHRRNLQWVKCKLHDKIYTLINVHGLWNGKGKTDCPERLAQSQKIRAFMDSIETPKILSGDLNLRPDTQSLKMLAQGMQNLIQIHNVPSTRTRLYTKKEPFADYILASPEVNIHAFEVLNEEVSDHSPLLVEFS